VYRGWLLNWHIIVKAIIAISVSCFKAIKRFEATLFIFVHSWKAVILKILPSALPGFLDSFAFEHMILVNFWPGRIRLNVSIIWNFYSNFFYYFPIFEYHFINYLLLSQKLLAKKSDTSEVILSQKSIIMKS